MNSFLCFKCTILFYFCEYYLKVKKIFDHFPREMTVSRISLYKATQKFITSILSKIHKWTMAGKNVSGDFFDSSMESSSPGVSLTKKEKKLLKKIEKQEQELKLKLNVSMSDEGSEKDENDKQDETESTPIPRKHTPIANKALEDSLEEINNKLNNVLKKTDTQFIKRIIQDTVNELKDSLLASVVKRIEIVEGELHDKQLENDSLKEKLGKMNKKLEEKGEENKKIKADQVNEKLRLNKIINNHEQYSRKNNLRTRNVFLTQKRMSPPVIDLLNSRLTITLLKLINPEGDYNSDNKNWY